VDRDDGVRLLPRRRAHPALLCKGWRRPLLAQHSTIAKYLPRFASPPAYDDRQHVYDFIGPRTHDPVVLGFNACLFA
jgi:hypothetical protein